MMPDNDFRCFSCQFYPGRCDDPGNWQDCEYYREDREQANDSMDEECQLQYRMGRE